MWFKIVSPYVFPPHESQRYWFVQAGVSHDPGSLDKWLTQNGGYANGCDIYWAKVDYYGKTSYQGLYFSHDKNRWKCLYHFYLKLFLFYYCRISEGIQRASESEICNGLNAKHGLVANVNGGGHWVSSEDTIFSLIWNNSNTFLFQVLLTACAGNGVYYVNDPGYSKTTYKHSEIVQLAVYH